MSQVDQVARKFEQMSRVRDEPSHSTTSGRLVETDGGYEQEIVSRSAARPRYASGDNVATVTTRRVRTNSGSRPSTPNSDSGAASTVISGTAAQGSATGGFTYTGLNRSAATTRSASVASTDNGASPTPAWRKPARPVPVSAYATVTEGSPASTTSSRRSLAFGNVDTRVVEPSRQSPLHVDTVYAPIKYVSRRQLQKMRQTGGSRSLQSQIRTSSIPRLDAERRTSSQGRTGSAGRAPASGRQFNDPTQQLQQQQRQQQQQRGRQQFTEAERAWRSQGGLPDASPPPKAPQPQPQRYSHSNSPASVRSVSSRASSARFSEAPAPNAPGSDPSLQLVEVAKFVAGLRRLSTFPEPPAYAAEAFRLLNRGTYLVKYGRSGAPHERWMSLRMMHDDAGRPQAYLVWALHNESQSISERLPLVHLLEVLPGAQTPGFQRHLVAQGQLKGPHVGSKTSILPTDFAFSMAFRSQQSSRTIDVLALDDQTCRCWLLVMSYFAELNTGGAGVLPDYAESVAPGSRSSSVHGR